MKEKLKQHLDGIFSQAPDNVKNRELKEEFYSNLCDRYDEYIALGKSENEAYYLSIRSLGDIHTLIGISDEPKKTEIAPGENIETKENSQSEENPRDSKRKKRKQRKGRRLLWWVVFILTFIAYFSISFSTHAWGITWLLFPINVAVNILIDGLYELGEVEK